jgi:hypothetical protein
MGMGKSYNCYKELFIANIKLRSTYVLLRWNTGTLSWELSIKNEQIECMVIDFVYVLECMVIDDEGEEVMHL